MSTLELVTYGLLVYWFGIVPLLFVAGWLLQRSAERRSELARINATSYEPPVLDEYRREIEARQDRAYRAAAHSRVRRTQFDADHSNRDRLGL